MVLVKTKKAETATEGPRTRSMSSVTSQVKDVKKSANSTNKKPVNKINSPKIPIAVVQESDEDLEEEESDDDEQTEKHVITGEEESDTDSESEEEGNDEDEDDSKEEKKDVKGKEYVTQPENAAQIVQGIKDQSRVALAALQKYFINHGGKSLFPELDHAVKLTVVYKKPALTTNHAEAKIQLPRSHRKLDNTTVCIIMPDLDQSKEGKTDPDVDKQARQWSEKIEKDHGLTSQHIAKILTKRQMEREYGQFKQKRELATVYDVFLADSRIWKAARSFLGKEFYKAHKTPMLFKYDQPLVDSIKKSLVTVRYPLKRYLTRASVGFGHLGQETSDLAENVDAVIDRVVNVAPGGLLNIRCIRMETAASKPSLPIYQDDGSANEVKLAPAEKKMRRLHQVKDECSTLPEGLKIAVRKGGKIRVIKEENNQAVLFPTIHDEWQDHDDIKSKIDPVKVEKKKRRNAKRKMALKTVKAELKSGETVISSLAKKKKTTA